MSDPFALEAAPSTAAAETSSGNVDLQALVSAARPPSKRQRKPGPKVQPDAEGDDSLTPYSNPNPRPRRLAPAAAAPPESSSALLVEALFNRAPTNVISTQYWDNSSSIFFGGVAATALEVVERFRREAVSSSLCCLDSSPIESADGPKAGATGIACADAQIRLSSSQPVSTSVTEWPRGSGGAAAPATSAAYAAAGAFSSDGDDAAAPVSARSAPMSAGVSSPSAQSPLSFAKLFRVSPLGGERLAPGAAGRVQTVADAFGVNSADVWAALTNAPPTTADSAADAGLADGPPPAFGFPPSDEGREPTSAQTVVLPNDGDASTFASSLTSQDAVCDALSQAMRQLAAIGARNSQRLESLSEALRLECSLQTLYAQLGKPLSVTAPDDSAGVGAAAPPTAAASTLDLEWDSSGALLSPCGFAVPSPGTLACEAALHNTYCALTGPRCDLELDLKLAADRGPATTWRFCSDAGDGAASYVPAPDPGMIPPVRSANRSRVGAKGPFQAAAGAPASIAEPDTSRVSRAWTFLGASAQVGFTALRLAQDSVRLSADVAEGDIAADAYWPGRTPRSLPFLPQRADLSGPVRASCEEAPVQHPPVDAGPVPADVLEPEAAGPDPGGLPVRRGRRGGRRGGGRQSIRGAAGRLGKRGARLDDDAAGSLSGDSADSDGSAADASAGLSAAEVAAAEAAAEADAQRVRLGRALERVRPVPFADSRRLLICVGAPFMSWDCPDTVGATGVGGPASENSWDFPEDVPWAAAAAEGEGRETSFGTVDASEAAALAAGAGDEGSKRRRASSWTAPRATVSATAARRDALTRAALAASAAVFTPGLLHPAHFGDGAGGAAAASHAAPPEQPAPYLGDVSVLPGRLVLQPGASPGRPRPAVPPPPRHSRPLAAPLVEPLSSEYRPPALPGLAAAAPHLDEVRRLLTPQASQRPGRPAPAAKGRRAGSRGRGEAAHTEDEAAPAPTLGAAQADIRAFLAAAPLGTVVEARDTAGGWYVAVIVAEARDAGAPRRYVRVRYGGWDSCVDDWVSVEASPPVVVPLGTHLRRRQAAGGGARGRR